MEETKISEEQLEKLMKSVISGETIEFVQKKSEKFLKLMTYYRCAIMEIETKFNVLNEEYSLEHDRNPICSIRTRLKTVDSIMEKLERKGLPKNVASMEENLNDIAGIRVICSFPEDVYALAEAFTAQDDITILEVKDYIKNPKPNGYRSLHMIVEIPIFLAKEKRMMKAEIQLRTIAMDFWATLEHQLSYKKDIDFNEEMAYELKQCADISAELDLRMDTLRKSCSAGASCGSTELTIEN